MIAPLLIDGVPAELFYICDGIKTFDDLRSYVIESYHARAAGAQDTEGLLEEIDDAERRGERLPLIAFDPDGMHVPICRRQPNKVTTRGRGYIDGYKPQQRTVDLLNDAKAVLEEYRKLWPLTARQIFYRLIGAYGYEKSDAFYGKLCHHLANARRARMIPFRAIRDDGVTTYDMEHFADADAFRAMVRTKAETYRRDLMARQAVHVEVWCEAAGMVPQLTTVTDNYSIHAYSSSGFDSLTAKKNLADRICRIGKTAVILHLGDYDPSGQAMFTVVAEDVGAFVKADRPNALVNVQFRRVALTEVQVSTYRLPTAPASSKDSRSKSWRGETCQLEALAPDQIAELLTAAIVDIVDTDQMNAELEEEEFERQQLTRLLPAPDSTASRKNDDAGGAA